jgi:predicted XRE-type DNA-binding protein
MAKSTRKSDRVIASSGNVFADLGIRDAATLDTKVRLAVAINRALAARKLTQVSAAALLGITQPKVSALKNFKLNGFSVERLMTCLTALGNDIQIQISLPRQSVRKVGRIVVAVA